MFAFDNGLVLFCCKVFFIWNDPFKYREIFFFEWKTNHHYRRYQPLDGGGTSYISKKNWTEFISTSIPKRFFLFCNKILIKSFQLVITRWQTIFGNNFTLIIFKGKKGHPFFFVINACMARAIIHQQKKNVVVVNGVDTPEYCNDHSAREFPNFFFLLVI